MHMASNRSPFHSSHVSARNDPYPVQAKRTFCSAGGPCWIRTNDQRIMRATSAFAARFRFVVWTLSCLSAFPSSLYTFSLEGASLGVGIAREAP